MATYWTDTTHGVEFTDIPGEWSDDYGSTNNGPALSIAIDRDAGIIVEGQSKADLVAWLRKQADAIDSEPGSTWVVGDPDPTPDVAEHDRCGVENLDAFVCTWPADHASGVPHVAGGYNGDDQVIAAVWPVDDSEATHG